MDRLTELWEKYRVLIFILGVIIALGIYWAIGKQGVVNNDATASAVMASSVSSTNTADKTTLGIVTVDVKGAVHKPGVYQLKADSRVNEAVNAAGGPLVSADLKQVNLAKQLSDQQMIYIPTVGEVVNNPIAASNISDGESNNSTVNLNTATKEQLCQVTGIGDKKADLILQYRQEHGQFKSVDELKEITGFGEKTVAKLKDHFSV